MDLLTIAFILIAIGLTLSACELVLPTHGLLFGLGASLALIGAVLSFDNGITTGLSTLVGLVIFVPVFSSTAMYFWRKSPAGRRLILEGPSNNSPPTDPGDLERLRGRYGRTLSALRPCGLVDFNGRRVDTVSGGEMIDSGQWVRCIGIREGRVVVRQTDAPPSLDEMNFKEL